ncbi:MAG: squalene/phytoene synthase family protein [Alphaproteobacteria bacterium]|nr:squalene/phytoene synthase family protein [Alphaproteobacteria bacterium]
MAAPIHCADLVRKLDRDRFLTAQFAPPERRDDLFALYAFNVEIAKTREVVNEPILGQVRLEWWRETVESLFAGQHRHHQVADALGRAIENRSLNRALFDGLIDAREFDLDGGPPATMAELERYAERTSANLTLLALQVLGFDDGVPALAGHHVGVAWAFTGLLRAVPYHARHRRLYLPQDMLAGAGIDQEELFAGRAQPGLSAVAAAVAQKAEEHLGQARGHRDVPRHALAALLPAVLATHYLDRMARVGYDVFDPGLATGGVGRLVKLWLHARRGRF